MKRTWLQLALILGLMGSNPAMGQLGSSEAALESAPPLGIEQIRSDLAKLDTGLLEATASDRGQPAELDTSDLKSASLRARDVYRRYLIKAEKISHDLIEIRGRLQPPNQAKQLSVQQLGALSQHISAQNTRLKGSFSHGEDQFRSYQLIQTAVGNLEDAIYYWRTANKYRELYRETAIEKIEDDDVLKLKIRTALNAIDELEEIFNIREALNSLEY